MELSSIEIFKMTPKKNCQKCGFITCMNFAMEVAMEKVNISACPYMPSEICEEIEKASKTEESCNERVKIEMESNMTAKELSYLIGLSEEKCRRFMSVNHMNGDEALEAIDIFMEALNYDVTVPVEIAECMRNAGIYSEMANRLGAYNTMRGGVKGYCGFVFEEMHAADAAAKGCDISVLGNNGLEDFMIKTSSGDIVYAQAKAGYCYNGKKSGIDWSRYEGQTIIVDKGNTALANEARSAGLKVQESAVFKKECDVVARAQQWESRVTGKKTAPVVGTVTSAHNAGLASAKFAARVGVSMKLGENIYDMFSGDKDFAEAAADVVVDGAVMIGGAYLGTAAFTAAGTVATTAATALGATAAGTAITGAVTTAAAAIGSTAAGAAVATGATAVATTAASAVATIAVAPLAPIIAGGAAIGFIGKWIRDNW